MRRQGPGPPALTESADRRGAIIAALSVVLLTAGTMGAVVFVFPGGPFLGVGALAVALASLPGRRGLLWATAAIVVAGDAVASALALQGALPWLPAVVALLATVATAAVADVWIRQAPSQRVLTAAAHDVRTPANAIRLQAALIRRLAAEPTATGRLANLTTQLEESAELLVRMMTDALGHARGKGHATRVAPAPSPAATLVGMRVVLAEDHDGTRSACTELLRGEGADVREARNGLEALELVDRVHPQVLLLDLRMPRLDGVGVLRRLRTARPSPLAAVVVVSGDRRAAAEREMRALGADAVLRKPIDPAVLISFLRGLNGRLQAQR